MKDLRLDIRVKNGLLLSKIEKTGKPLYRLAEDMGMSFATLERYVNCRMSPLDRNLEWKASARCVADFFRVPPEMLFSDSVRKIQKNRISVSVSGEEVMKFLAGSESNTDPRRQLENFELSRDMTQVLSTLRPKRRRALEMCFLEDLTFAEAAEALGVTPNCVQLLVAKGLRDLRKSNNTKILKPYIEE